MDQKGEILQLMGDDVAFADTFEGLYRSSVAEMTRVSFLITGSTHAAEEITHDAFIAVRGRWNSIRNPHAYLRRAVANRSRSYRRHLRVVRGSPVEPARASRTKRGPGVVELTAERPETAL